MKKFLNTAYITTEGSSLRKDGENLIVENEGTLLGRIPFHMLSSVVVFGSIFVSPALIGACASRGLTLVFLERNGKFAARVEGPVSGNVLLRKAQYKASETPEEIVKGFLIGKIANQRAVIRRALRDYGEEFNITTKNILTDVTEKLADNLRFIHKSNAKTDILRGVEGDSAQLYFSVFDFLIRPEDPKMRFNGRFRRPPPDPVNALLSFLYTLLTHDCRSAAEAVGLDPAVGFLHKDRPGRPSLALDLMEELRPVFADRLVLSLINRKQLKSSDFEFREGNNCTLSDEGRKIVLNTWQERKKEERLHDFLEEKSPLGLIPYLQAQLLARYLRGDLEAYPSWFWK